MPADRRTFLKTLNILIGGAIGAVVAVPVLGYVLFPVRKKTVLGTDDPIPIADLDDLPTGQPVRIPVVAPSQRDAWSSVRNVTLGAVWVRKDADGKAVALSATCPHLGCSVDFKPDDQGSGDFRCPCHTSAFDIDGKHKSGPAKRGMDPIDVEMDGKRVLVRFARFKLDTPTREKA